MARAYYQLKWRDMDEWAQRRVLDTLAWLSHAQGTAEQRGINAWLRNPAAGYPSDSPAWKRRDRQMNNIIHFILGRDYATTSRKGGQ